MTAGIFMPASFPAEVIDAFGSGTIPIIAYPDRVEQADVDLSLHGPGPEQVAPVIRGILGHRRARPLVFVTDAACQPEQLRGLQNIRDAHPGIAIAFWRDLRYLAREATHPAPAPARCHPDIGRVTSIDIHHRPDVTGAELHELIHYALALTGSRPAECRLTDAGLDVELRYRDATRAQLTLAPDAPSQDLVHVTSTEGRFTFEPGTLPKNAAHRWMLSECEDLFASLGLRPRARGGRRLSHPPGHGNDQERTGGRPTGAPPAAPARRSLPGLAPETCHHIAERPDESALAGSRPEVPGRRARPSAPRHTTIRLRKDQQ